MKLSTISSLTMSAGTLALSVPAIAGFNSTMFQSSAPSTWADATLIASLDSSNFDFPDDSGFELVFGNIVFDRTSVRSDVYRADAPRVINTGGSSLTLDAGDLVFAYTIRLVQAAPGSTVNTVNEIQAIGAPDFGFGADAMAASLINGQGFVVTTVHDNTPTTGNIDDAAEFGSSVDWEWPGFDSGQLDNSDTITLLLFTDPAAIGTGVLNLISPPGQIGGITGVAQAAEAPPILIPIIPSPGATVLAIAGLGLTAARRRRI